MKFSLNFIQEFLKFEVSPQKLAHLLTMAGMEVESLEKIGGDWVFNIEVTTNRYDWLSIIGITREIAAILGKNFKLKYPFLIRESRFSKRNIIITDPKDCPYYIGRFIKAVKVGASSQRLKTYLLNCGLTSVNNIVDITNYCMLKWGNPLHAFDDDKLEGDIYIRRAKRGESFLGIDGKERILEDTNLVIADDKKVIALAGVMGAKNTEVDGRTKNIFLEAAIFSPLTVRRSRRAVGLDTESSYRFERQVSPNYLEYASLEAAQLIEKLGQGTCGGFRKAGRKPVISRKKIIVSLANLDSYLGVSPPVTKISNILKGLGFNLKRISKDKLSLLAPTHRFDIQRDVDVYEEIARIYGYQKIAAKIPFLKNSLNGSNNNKIGDNLYNFKNELARYISLLGFKEIITYSIEDTQQLPKSGDSDRIIILNPLRKQENVLRSNLLLGMIKSIRYNLNRNQSCLRFFELAHIYYRDKRGFCEAPALALGLSGKERDFFYLKGAVEKILYYLNITKFELIKDSFDYFYNALKVRLGKQTLGFLGKLDEAVKRSCDIKEDIFFAQFDLNKLNKQRREKQYKPFSPYPVIWRDISIVLDKNVAFKEVEEIIKSKSNYFAGLDIIDVYQGKDISPETFAFTLRVFYQSPRKTLASEEVDTFHNDIREALSQQKGLRLR